MIISVFATHLETNQNVFRSSDNLSSSKINYYITEFLGSDLSDQGIIHKDTYNYIYMTNSNFRIVIQASKDSLYSDCHSLLKQIDQNSENDMFDMLFTIDNVLTGSDGLKMDLQQIKSMNSQDEKIFNMMMENKMMETRKREKDYQRKTEIKDQDETVPKNIPPVKVAEIKPKKVEKSNKPVLIIIKEKLKLEIDKENYIKENLINGEISMVIYDPEYKQVQLKMSNLKGSIKFSPYLEKEALKKNILRFEKDRGINKSIPLLKWTGKGNNTPLGLEFWNDEEDGKYLNVFEFKAKKDLDDLEIRFNKKNITEVEVDQNILEENNFITYKIGNLKKDESAAIEIKWYGGDNKSLFPIEASFRGQSIDSSIDVTDVILEEKSIKEYEVRKSFETESFVVLND